MINKNYLSIFAIILLSLVTIVTASTLIDYQESDFNSGTYNFTFYNSSGFVQLNSSRLNGTFTSQIFNSGGIPQWNNISWFTEVPYNQELPNNQAVETGDFLRGMNMTGNVLLLHLNNDSAYGENSTHVYDFSGNGNNGTLVGGEGDEVTSAGKLDGAFEFDGVDDYVNIGNADKELYSNMFTVTAWIKRNVIGGEQHLFSAGGGRQFYVSGSSLKAQIRNDSNSVFTTSDVALNDLEWHFVGIVMNGTAVRIFVDETSSPWKATEGSFANPSTTVLMGAYTTTPSLLFNGSIDEVAIFNRSLSSTEIQDIYKRGALRLNLSVQSCDDALCEGELWTNLGNNITSPQNLSVANNPYFQYKTEFETDNAIYSPELYNVSVGYTNPPPSSNLISPTDATTLEGSEQTFTCNATAVAGNLQNISLYHNATGTWHLNATNNVSGSENETSFTVSGLDYTTFVWNCLATDSNGLSSFADSNFTLTTVADSTNPAINSYSITSSLTSGETATIRANITDASSISLVWFTINNTDGTQTNYTMSQEGSTDFYNVSFEVGKIGNWYYKVYANDSYSNLNNSMGWQSFSVAKPSATAQNEVYPTYALPSSSITITADLSANDLLKQVNATLNVPSGFEFPFTSYDQNQSKGNFSAGDTQTARWFVYLPNTNQTYNFNVSWTDMYNNIWQGSNKEIIVTYDTANLTGRVTTLEGLVTTLQSDVSTLQSQMTTVQTDISNLNDTVNSINETVQSNLASITSLQSDVSTLQSQMTNVQNGIVSLNNSIQNNTANITTLFDNINSLISKTDSLNSSLISLESNVSANTLNITNINSQIIDINSNITSLLNDITVINTNIDSLNTSVINNTDLITNLRADLTNLNSTVVGIQENISINQINISTLFTNIGTVQIDITDLQSSVASINTTVNQNSENITTLNGNVTQLNTDITSINTNLTYVWNNLTDLYNKVNNNTVNITDIRDDITNINSQITDINNNINSLNNSINSLNSTTSLLSNATHVNIISFVELEAGNVYNAEIDVRDAYGQLADADSVKISLYDPNGNIVVSAVDFTSKIATGRYSYNYTTPSTPTGEWIILATVSRNGNDYTDREYWRLTGGPFDIRGITITDSTVSILDISTILENMGDGVTDIVVDWNLTREDTGALLDSGQDTIGVTGQQTHTIAPSTSYIGEVRITFLGTWSSTEKAGAFSTFTTTSESSGGESGGGGTAPGPDPVEVVPEEESEEAPEEKIEEKPDIQTKKEIENLINDVENKIINLENKINALNLDEESNELFQIKEKLNKIKELIKEGKVQEANILLSTLINELSLLESNIASKERNIEMPAPAEKHFLKYTLIITLFLILALIPILLKKHHKDKKQDYFPAKKQPKINLKIITPILLICLLVGSIGFVSYFGFNFIKDSTSKKGVIEQFEITEQNILEQKVEQPSPSYYSSIKDPLIRDMVFILFIVIMVIVLIKGTNLKGTISFGYGSEENQIHFTKIKDNHSLIHHKRKSRITIPHFRFPAIKDEYDQPMIMHKKVKIVQKQKTPKEDMKKLEQYGFKVKSNENKPTVINIKNKPKEQDTIFKKKVIRKLDNPDKDKIILKNNFFRIKQKKNLKEIKEVSSEQIIKKDKIEPERIEKDISKKNLKSMYNIIKDAEKPLTKEIPIIQKEISKRDIMLNELKGVFNG